MRQRSRFLPQVVTVLLSTCLVASCVSSSGPEEQRKGPSPGKEGVKEEIRFTAAIAEARKRDEQLARLGYGEGMLPKYKTAKELEVERLSKLSRLRGQPLWDSYDDYRKLHIDRYLVTQPPQSQGFRAPAEFEQSQAYVLNWQDYYSNKVWTELFIGIIKGAWGVVPVLMIYKDAKHKNWVQQKMAVGGIPAAELNDPAKIIWFQASSNAIWARDFGPLSIVSSASTGKRLSFVDFRYYHTRHLDDRVPTDLAEEWGINAFRPDLEFEGGNFMNTTDGLCAATKGVLYYNLQFTQAAVEQIFAEYLGCKKSIFTAPMKGVIEHIDMYSKFGSDTALLMGEYTAAQAAKGATLAANKAILDAVAAQFASTKTPSGKTITVTRIPMPDNTGLGFAVWRTYTNSTALKGGKEKVVLIPTYSKYAASEQQAMAAYATVFPGWKLVKIESEIIIPMQGAIHCITMQIPLGQHRKMEAAPADQCGQKVQCVKRICGNITDKGCCTPEGILKVCSSKSGKLIYYDCSGNPQCGWQSSKSLYNCGTSGGADPGGTHERSCNVLTDAALPDMGPDSGSPCDHISYEGCCRGEQVWYCVDGQLEIKNCHSSPKCGWNAQEKYYYCSTNGDPDPTGTYPKNCPDLDAGIPNPCGAITKAGCCEGTTLKICDKNMLEAVPCPDQCGWSTKLGHYQCGKISDQEPSGRFPLHCPGAEPDAGPPDLGADMPLPDLAPLPDQRPDVADATAADGGDGSPPEDGGCSCRMDDAAGTGKHGTMVLALGLVFGLVFWGRRRRRTG